jgi:predicted RNA-binding Zn ribbon-like protein
MTQPVSAEPRFEYVGGDPALDLINTVDWTSRGPEHERLESYEQLTRWAQGAGVIDAAIGRRLRRLGEAHPRTAAAALAFALQARGTSHDVFAAIARGDPAEPELARFNRLLHEALRGLEVARTPGGEGSYRWRWRGEDGDLRGLVWPVLWSAANLLRSDEIGNVRVCDGDDCGWMYVDRSRNGFRRWCQMRTCGTREKTRRRRGSGSTT